MLCIESTNTARALHGELKNAVYLVVLPAFAGPS